MILIPLGILLVVRLVPAGLMAEFRGEAERREAEPASTAGAVAIVALWVGAAALLLWWFWPRPAV